jgi:predicted nucleic acid-binding protein
MIGLDTNVVVRFLTRDDPAHALRARALIARALDWCGQGLDFADALHLASSGRAEAFATFDRALRRRARAVTGTVPVVAP